MNFSIVDKRVLVLGKTNSGKSVLIKYLLNHFQHEFKKVFVICPTEKINSFYSNLVPEENIFSEYDDNWIITLIKKMTELKSKDKGSKDKILLILDDIGSDAVLSKMMGFKMLCVRGRHVNISVMISAQYLYQLPPIARANMCYIVVGQSNQQSSQLLADEFLICLLYTSDAADE